jgi:hypothetical protein
MMTEFLFFLQPRSRTLLAGDLVTEGDQVSECRQKLADRTSAVGVVAQVASAHRVARFEAAGDLFGEIGLRQDVIADRCVLVISVAHVLTISFIYQPSAGRASVGGLA